MTEMATQQRQQEAGDNGIPSGIQKALTYTENKWFWERVIRECRHLDRESK